MSRIAERLVLRLLFVQIGIAALTEILVATFAPKLLLLADASVEDPSHHTAWAALTVLVVEVIATLVLTRPLTACLRALEVGATAVDPADVLRLYALPSWLTVVDSAAAFLTVMATLVPAFRPPTNDLLTQLEILVLAVTTGSIAALVSYVMMRSVVAKVLEGVPEASKRDALAILELAPPPLPRVRMRLLFAVALPVGFVALGASLLVFAHVRAFDASLRETHAAELVRGVFEVAHDEDPGRREAALAFAQAGFDVRFDGLPDELRTVHHVDGTTYINVPLASGGATVRFLAAPITPATVVYVLITVLVFIVASLLGARVGGLLAADIALVTREVRNLGVADVLKGTQVHRVPRLDFMRDLAAAIDDLGSIFREFASTQEKAIEAKAAAERMRGLFLASMSHDLKAPLNAILGFAQLASRKPLTASQLESLAIIEQRGRELLHLIQTILDAARAEAGELPVAPERQTVGDAVMAAMLEARELVSEDDVAIVAEVDPRTPAIVVDPARFVQALTLVVLTGVRLADDGVVRVRASAASSRGRVRIDIEVPGLGVRGDVGLLFQAFRDPERARRHGSLGLGLSLARSIVEQHGGTLDATTSEKRGTIFRIAVPSADAPLDALSPASGSSVSLSGNPWTLSGSHTGSAPGTTNPGTTSSTENTTVTLSTKSLRRPWPVASKAARLDDTASRPSASSDRETTGSLRPPPVSEAEASSPGREVWFGSPPSEPSTEAATVVHWGSRSSSFAPPASLPPPAPAPPVVTGSITAVSDPPNVDERSGPASAPRDGSGGFPSSERTLVQRTPYPPPARPVPPPSPPPRPPMTTRPPPVRPTTTRPRPSGLPATEVPPPSSRPLSRPALPTPSPVPPPSVPPSSLPPPSLPPPRPPPAPPQPTPAPSTPAARPSYPLPPPRTPPAPRSGPLPPPSMPPPKPKKP